MNIHNYEKLWLIAAMLLIIGFIVTITYGSVGLGIAMIDDSEETIDPNALEDHERFGDLGVHQTGDGEYDVNIRAYQFNFEPGSSALGVHDPIVVPENSEVTLYVTSPDVIHSFSVVGTNANTMVVPGEISVMTVEFNEAREYGILCNEYCGSGHHGMEGVIEVVPEDEFHLFSVAGVDAPESAQAGDEVEITATVDNDALDADSAAVSLEIGEETFENELEVDAESSASTTFTVDTGALDLEDAVDIDWTVTVEDGSEATLEDGSASGSIALETDDDENDDTTDDDNDESDGGDQ
ncbi:cytochrome c oxidase subunit II [Halobacteria archaeon AArc-curdl1]|uniref:Cytochrome c oxidase subunit II n=1 Tax=Natronosalvus hydrolyticus TaxID=2979988 RepID=A0AAP3E725_9EURY|nr:cytochrome c oxidase subunit II [Halobacteria archaeon AArc-curdl1]